MAAEGTQSLGTRTLRGVLWTYGSFATCRLLVLASTAVLAHLLSPRDFGLVALAVIFTAALDSVRDIGVNQALVVSRREDVAAEADTAFWFTVLVGMGLALVVAGISPLAAAFFHQPSLVPLLVVLGVNLPLRGLGLTHYALAQRRLDFRSRTVAELADVVVRGALGIGLALAGLGPWSLVFGYLAGTLAMTAALWITVAWRPSYRPRRTHRSRLLRFGGTLTVVDFIGSAMGNVDNLFVGRVLGASALGAYSLGYRLPELLISGVGSLAGLALFPAFARVERSVLHVAVTAAFRYALLLGLPIAVAMLALAHPLVLALFGGRWNEAAPVMQVLSVAYLGAPLSQVTGSAYKASRRVDVLLKLAVPQGLLLVSAIAIFVDQGIVAVAACQAGVRVTFLLITVYVSTRVLGLRPHELWDAAWPAIAAGAAMAAVIVPLDHAITSPWTTLTACGLLGGGVYLGIVRLLAPDAIPRLWRLLRGSGSGRTEPASVPAAWPR